MAGRKGRGYRSQAARKRAEEKARRKQVEYLARQAMARGEHEDRRSA